jgi:hypothetical protein
MREKSTGQAFELYLVRNDSAERTGCLGYCKIDKLRYKHEFNNGNISSSSQSCWLLIADSYKVPGKEICVKGSLLAMGVPEARPRCGLTDRALLGDRRSTRRREKFEKRTVASQPLRCSSIDLKFREVSIRMQPKISPSPFLRVIREFLASRFTSSGLNHRP